MAVQDAPKSRAYRGHRHAHWKRRFKTPTLSVDATSGETHRRHHVTEDGYYRGRKLIETAAVATASDE